MNRVLVLLLLFISCTKTYSQTKSTPEYLASAGFSQVNDSTWSIADRATVIMKDNYVKAFEAQQNHSWTMTFGNGSKEGVVVNVKKGDKIVFSNGRLTFGNNSSYCPASLDNEVLFKRSILRSAIFNSAREVLFATDVKVVNPNAASLGKFHPANSSEEYALDAYGNIRSKVAASNAALQAKRDNNLTMAKRSVENHQISDYENLCKKYGRNVIEGLQNGKIMVGAPIDLVMKMLGTKQNGTDMSYGSKVISSTTLYETREFSPEVYSPGERHVHYYVTYNKNTKRVTNYYTLKKLY